MLSMKFFLPYEPPPEERKSSSAKSPPVKSPQQGSPTSPSLPPSKKGSPTGLVPITRDMPTFMKKMWAKQNFELSNDSAERVQNAFRGMQARIRVRKMKELRDLIFKLTYYAAIPLLGPMLLYSLLMAFRCSLPIFPLPADGWWFYGWSGGCEALPNWWVPSKPATTWRQKISCCDRQQVSVPIPRGAEYHDLVALQWFEGGKRYISYRKIDELSIFREPTVTFNVPWTLAGHAWPGGRERAVCAPSPLRDCQYGDTPYIEMAAVEMSCQAKNGQCHAPVQWSWGEESFTIPKHSHAPDDDDGDGVLGEEGEEVQDVTMMANGRNIM